MVTITSHIDSSPESTPTHHIYHGQPYARVDLNPMPESTYPPVGFLKLSMSPGIDSKESVPPAFVASAGIFKQSRGARNQVGIGLSYRPVRLHSLAEFVYWNRFLSSLKV
jgi:hypothetical protein